MNEMNLRREANRSAHHFAQVLELRFQQLLLIKLQHLLSSGESPSEVQSFLRNLEVVEIAASGKLLAVELRARV
jgi:hypothetical protein